MDMSDKKLNKGNLHISCFKNYFMLVIESKRNKSGCNDGVDRFEEFCLHDDFIMHTNLYIYKKKS